MSCYHAMEFHGTGDPMFGGSADDRPLGKAGAFLRGCYSLDDIAEFSTREEEHEATCPIACAGDRGSLRHERGGNAMSAYLVGKDTIDAILTAWVQFALLDPWCARPRFDEREQQAVEIGQLLWDENYASLRALYGAPEAGVGTPIYETFQPVAFPRDPRPAAQVALVVAVLRLLDCYEYQSCEHDGWAESRAATFCRHLREEVIRTLPGWKAGPWGADGNRNVFIKTLADVAAERAHAAGAVRP